MAMSGHIKPEPFVEEHVEPFQEIVTIPDLFSMEEVGDGLGLLSPSVMDMAPDDEQRSPLLSLKEGSSGADATLSSLNTRESRIAMARSIPFVSLPSPRPMMDLESASSSSSNSMQQDKQDMVVKTELDEKDMLVVEQNVEKENVTNLKKMMAKPTIARPSKRQLVNQNGQPNERKRPGRKRLELPSEEEVQHITDPIMKKRLQNRKASRECRARKADYLGEIEEKVRKLESENAELSFKYSQVVEERTKANNENLQLRLKLDQFERHFKSMNISPLAEIAVC